MSDLLHYGNIKAMLTTLKRKDKSGPFYKGMLAEVIELVDLCAKMADGVDDDEMDEIKSRVREILS